MTLEIKLAKKEMKEKIHEVKVRYGIPACIIEGIIQEIIVDLKEESADSLMNEVIEKLSKKNEEIEKAKKEAKKVLKKDSITEQEEDEKK